MEAHIYVSTNPIKSLWKAFLLWIVTLGMAEFSVFYLIKGSTFNVIIFLIVFVSTIFLLVRSYARRKNVRHVEVTEDGVTIVYYNLLSFSKKILIPSKYVAVEIREFTTGTKFGDVYSLNLFNNTDLVIKLSTLTDGFDLNMFQELAFRILQLKEKLQNG